MDLGQLRILMVIANSKSPKGSLFEGGSSPSGDGQAPRHAPGNRQPNAALEVGLAQSCLVESDYSSQEPLKSSP
jgi:hypothetical protein